MSVERGFLERMAAFAKELPREEPVLTAAPVKTAEIGEITVGSDPAGAEIVNGQEFVGNTPSTWKVSPGTYTITITKKGYAPWTRIITVSNGDKKTLVAELVKE